MYCCIAVCNNGLCFPDSNAFLGPSSTRCCASWKSQCPDTSKHCLHLAHLHLTCNVHTAVCQTPAALRKPAHWKHRKYINAQAGRVTSLKRLEPARASLRCCHNAQRCCGSAARLIVAMTGRNTLTHDNLSLVESKTRFSPSVPHARDAGSVIGNNADLAL